MKINAKRFFLLLLGGSLTLPFASEGFAVPARRKDALSPLDIPVGKGANDLQINVAPEGPGTRKTPLQIACFFEHQPGGDEYSGGTGDFVAKTRGLIKHLRDRGEFSGYELETLLITPPAGTVPAKKLLLIGLGDPATFNAERLRRVGTVALREALRLGVSKVSFSPNVTDGGVKSVPVKDYDETAIEGVLLAYDTEKRLQKEGASPARTLKEFTLEAGHDNVPFAIEAVQTAIVKTKAQIAARPTEPYLDRSGNQSGK